MWILHWTQLKSLSSLCVSATWVWWWWPRNEIKMTGSAASFSHIRCHMGPACMYLNETKLIISEINILTFVCRALISHGFFGDNSNTTPNRWSHQWKGFWSNNNNTTVSWILEVMSYNPKRYMYHIETDQYPNTLVSFNHVILWPLHSLVDHYCLTNENLFASVCPTEKWLLSK